jgi:hypothetical protein
MGSQQFFFPKDIAAWDRRKRSIKRIITRLPLLLHCHLVSDHQYYSAHPDFIIALPPLLITQTTAKCGSRSPANLQGTLTFAASEPVRCGKCGIGQWME